MFFSSSSSCRLLMHIYSRCESRKKEGRKQFAICIRRPWICEGSLLNFFWQRHPRSLSWTSFNSFCVCESLSVFVLQARTKLACKSKKSLNSRRIEKEEEISISSLNLRPLAKKTSFKRQLGNEKIYVSMHYYYVRMESLCFPLILYRLFSLLFSLLTFWRRKGKPVTSPTTTEGRRQDLRSVLLHLHFTVKTVYTKVSFVLFSLESSLGFWTTLICNKYFQDNRYRDDNSVMQLSFSLMQFH